MSDVICFPIDKCETLTSVVYVVNRNDKKKYIMLSTSVVYVVNRNDKKKYIMLRKKKVCKGNLTLIFHLTFKATWYNNHKRPT